MIFKKWSVPRGGGVDFRVPIMVDSKKEYDGFEMTRCSYYSIESLEPYSETTIDIGEMDVNVLVLNLEGVFINSIGAKLFDSANIIKNIIENIEKEGTHIVNVNEIWYPNDLLDRTEKGTMYRIKKELFARGLEYQMGKLDLKEFIAYCREHNEDCSYSELETEAFKDYHHNTIEEAKKYYKMLENEGRTLKYIDKEEK